MKHWDLFQVFVYVVETGSFSRAASRLHVSKSLVSKKVTQLERHLNTQLLYRTTRHVTPTDVGHELYRKCEKIFATLEEVEQSAFNLDSLPRGYLRVVCTDILGEKFVSRVAAMFAMLHPNLRIDVHVTSRLVDLVAEGYDLAVRYGKLADSSLKARKVYEMPHVVCATPEYFKKHGLPEEIEDLKKHNCLVATFEPCTPWRFKVNKKTVEVDLEGSWRSNNASALITASLQGLGICRLPDLYLREYIETGVLQPIFEQYQYDPLPVWFVYPSTRYVPAKTRLFIDYFLEQIPVITQSS